MNTPISIVNTLLESDYVDYDPNLDPFSDPKNVPSNTPSFEMARHLDSLGVDPDSVREVCVEGFKTTESGDTEMCDSDDPAIEGWVVALTCIDALSGAGEDYTMDGVDDIVDYKEFKEREHALSEGRALYAWLTERDPEFTVRFRDGGTDAEFFD